MSPQVLKPLEHFVTTCFFSEGLLARRPTAKTEDNPFSAVLNSLFNIFVTILHTWCPSPGPANPRFKHITEMEMNIISLNYRR